MLRCSHFVINIWKEEENHYLDHSKALLNHLSLQLTSCPSAPVKADKGEGKPPPEKSVAVQRWKFSSTTAIYGRIPQVEDGHKPSSHHVDVLLVLQALPAKPLNGSRLSLFKDSLCWELFTSGDPQHDDVLHCQPYSKMSTSAYGGPRSQVCARYSLHTGPHRHCSETWNKPIKYFSQLWFPLTLLLILHLEGRLYLKKVTLNIMNSY